MPNTPQTPHAADHPTSAPCGIGSPRPSPMTRAKTMPASRAPVTTMSTGAPRASVPPPKSPAPHASADASPRTTTAAPGPSGSGSGRLHGLLVGVGRRGPVEEDDLVGEVVVPVRGRQV